MKRILILLVLVFSLSMVADAKPKYHQSRGRTTTYKQYKKTKHKKTKVYHYNSVYKHKKCRLSKVYPVK
jgi:hypothetical protein